MSSPFVTQTPPQRGMPGRFLNALRDIAENNPFVLDYGTPTPPRARTRTPESPEVAPFSWSTPRTKEQGKEQFERNEVYVTPFIRLLSDRSNLFGHLLAEGGVNAVALIQAVDDLCRVGVLEKIIVVNQELAWSDFIAAFPNVFSMTNTLFLNIAFYPDLPGLDSNREAKEQSVARFLAYPHMEGDLFRSLMAIFPFYNQSAYPFQRPHFSSAHDFEAMANEIVRNIDRFKDAYLYDLHNIYNRNENLSPQGEF